MDLSSVVILKEYSRKLWRSITRPMSWVTSFNELNTEKITKKKKNFITYATRKVYANMINLQGIRTRSFAPFESKGIFTKKEKRKNTIYPKVKLLTKTFTLARMKNIFENFLLITQRVKKKKKLQSDRLNLNEYNSRGILLKILENFSKRNSHLRYNTFPSDYDQGKQLKRYTRSTIHGDRCPTLIGRHGSDRVQFT